MSYAARGIYHDLLDVQWEDGFIPENPMVLLSCKKEEWDEFSPHLDKCFPVADEGRKNKRCDEEREKALAKVEKNRLNGTKGGRPKKENPTVSVGKPNGFLEKTQQKPNRHRDIDIDIDTPISPKGEGGRVKKFDPLSVKLPPNLESPDGEKAWLDWITHLRQKHKPPTQEAVRRQLVSLSKMSDPIGALDYCIGHNYQGVFEPPAKRDGLNGRAQKHESVEEIYARL